MQESKPRDLTDEELQIANSPVSTASFSEPVLDLAGFETTSEARAAKLREDELSSPQTTMAMQANVGDEAMPASEPPQP